MTINKRLVGGFLALIALFVGSVVLAYHAGTKDGYASGLTDYHNMCYNGGLVIIGDKAIMCGPLTQLPPSEIPLDKGRKV